MGMLLVFAAGYVMGARAGGESFDDVVDAVHAIRESEEFHDLVKALRSHAAHSLARAGDHAGERVVNRSSDERTRPGDLVDRVRLIVGLR